MNVLKQSLCNKFTEKWDTKRITPPTSKSRGNMSPVQPMIDAQAVFTLVNVDEVFDVRERVDATDVSTRWRSATDISSSVTVVPTQPT